LSKKEFQVLEVRDGKKLSVMDPDTFAVEEVFVGDMNPAHLEILSAMENIELMVCNEVPVKINFPAYANLEVQRVKSNVAKFRGTLSLAVNPKVKSGDIIRLNTSTLEIDQIIPSETLEKNNS
jgi:hypothetical protein